MYGISSISQVKKRIDTFNKSDWQFCISDGQAVSRSVARDPFLSAFMNFRVVPDAIWGFDNAISAIRFIYGSVPVAEQSEETLCNPTEDTRKALDLAAGLAPHLLKNSRFLPNLEALSGLLSYVQHSSAYFDINLGVLCKDLTKSHELYWIGVEAIQLALLVEKEQLRDQGGAIYYDSNAQLQRISGLVHDYHAFRLPYWRSVPAIRVSEDVGSDEVERLRDIFADPLSFCPREADDEGRFEWPWQRCLVIGPSGEVRYRAIGTTSLTLDLRASTSAMELTDPPEQFSEFIDTVVGAARSIILEHGGFFDKETGDGVVGHFCTHRNVSETDKLDELPTEVVAVRSAIRIVKAIDELCLKYQRWLRHGMDRLGPAIGIHTGTAVWIIDEMQIRAIGSSVVGAARLCGCAASREIVISNKTFHAIEDHRAIVNVIEFHKKAVSFQEYGERLGTYAYSGMSYDHRGAAS
ncbi:adenylate/guanylate cyclase domain-containing protein [Rhodopseudomonas palustris]|uniref:adenylate/guanylate cyclase domain-containing protein n=1 Tax=Rhodopseudomonas palustris TaxID=1076 RepID=UPI002ACDF559|nr:adenylate/guanylate cyclase domain-containing protein [Rhodopseudomonas palustris]WQH01529.1 adenylate/guanylate cyclase domain-containing protein [Rhodopseudomonas palustris]